MEKGERDPKTFLIETFGSNRSPKNTFFCLYLMSALGSKKVWTSLLRFSVKKLTAKTFRKWYRCSAAILIIDPLSKVYEKFNRLISKVTGVATVCFLKKIRGCSKIVNQLRKSDLELV